VTEYR